MTKTNTNTITINRAIILLTKMEQHNNNNEFEHFLKDSIADFIMIPQRKVWYGIYNHLHPEKKWPSIAVCFFILVSIMHIGISNNKNINTDVQQAKTELQNKQNIFGEQIKKDNATNQLSYNISEKIVSEKIENSKATINTLNNLSKLSFASNDITKENKSFTKSQTKSSINTTVENSSATENILDEVIKLVSNNNAVSEAENSITNTNTLHTNKDNRVNPLQSFTTKNNSKNNNTEKKINNILENNISGYNSLVKLPKRKTKNEITYYVTPSVGYRVMELNDGSKSASLNANSAAITTSYGTDATGLEDKKAFNFEIGAAVSKCISKKLKVSVGVQLNYTNYISKATSLSHPTQNTVAKKNSNAQFTNMDYSSAPGGISLNKTTLQISVPVGIAHKILGNDRVNWNVAATLQPAVVIAGSGYVLSADKKYYVAEKDLLNRFNISTAVETFLSIKTASGIRLNVGPQLRYQLTSTYKKNYNFSENLYNIGLKIGVSTSL